MAADPLDNLSRYEDVLAARYEDVLAASKNLDAFQASFREPGVHVSSMHEAYDTHRGRVPVS